MAALSNGKRDWAFRADMNYDGLVTISDVWLWFKSLFYYPGDLAVAGLLATPVGDFFEMTWDSYGGFGLSFVVSVLTWLVVLFFAALAVEDSQHKDSP